MKLGKNAAFDRAVYAMALLLAEPPRDEPSLEVTITRLYQKFGKDQAFLKFLRQFVTLKDLSGLSALTKPSTSDATTEDMLVAAFRRYLVGKNRSEFPHMLQDLCEEAFWRPHEALQTAKLRVKLLRDAAKRHDVDAMLAAALRLGIFCGEQIELVRQRPQRIREVSASVRRKLGAASGARNVKADKAIENAPAKADWLRMVGNRKMTRRAADEAIAARYLPNTGQQSGIRTVQNWRSPKNGNWAAEL